MAVINPHTTRATGTVLTAAIYNADHQNHITNANSLNAALGAAGSIGSTTGIIVSNGAGVISGRSIVGTANQIAVANANGTAGDPTLSIATNPTLPGNVTVSGNLTVSGTISSGGSLIQEWSGLLLVPTNKSYKIVLKCPFPGTITETTTICVSGTCTATFKINAAALDGAANAVSSAEQSIAHAASNAFVAGDDIVITVSANAACLDMSYGIKYTR